MIIDFTKNKKQELAVEAVQSEKYNFILFGGAIRGGKTIWGLGTLLLMCHVFPRSRWCVIREDIEKLRTTTIPSFEKLEPSGTLRSNPYSYVHPNGSVILFKGENYSRDKDLDWMRGLEVNGFLFEELQECKEITLQKAFQRSGAWIIPDTEIQPNPIILATANPSFDWVKREIYDRWKAGTLPPKWLYIQSKITDNPFLPQSYLESLSNMSFWEYEVFVNGNWEIQLKTGNEFLKSFELSLHLKNLKIDTESPLHISIDSNVQPGINVTFWQLEKIENYTPENVNKKTEFVKWKIKQVHEMVVKDPHNTARKAGQMVANFLKSIGYDLKVFLYGDPTTKSRNNIDDTKKSFLDLFKEPFKNGFLIEERFFHKAPNVSNTADFINDILEGKIPTMEIIISENCKESITDYIEIKQDKDGGMLKKRVTDKQGISYEPHGHLLDTMRYFIVKCFEVEFNQHVKRYSNYADSKLPTLNVSNVIGGF